MHLSNLVGKAVGIIGLLALWAGTGPASAEDAPWRVGLARAKVTPEEPIRLSGYGGRSKPSDGVLSDLYVKALAIEQPGSRPALLLTADLIDVGGAFTNEICRRIGKETGLKREEILLVPSHTHAGPILVFEAADYGLKGEQLAAVERYSAKLMEQLTHLAVAAMADRRPARLSWGAGKADFVMNRRERTGDAVKIGVNREGYVDASVPVLRVDEPDGRLRALVFGCACHNTTLGSENLKICAEYAGYAQEELERKDEGAQAMFVIGCGADANPYPRGTAALAQQHGRSLAAEVARVAGGKLRPVGGPLRTLLDDVDLPLASPPSRERLVEMSKGPSYLAGNARGMLRMLERGEQPPRHYRAPLAVWQFGRDLTLVALSGEVVSDYVPLIQKAVGADGLWIAAYANDALGYVPSKKVLAEGGYETRGLNFVPGFFAPEVEDVLVAKVHQMVQHARGGQPAKGSEPGGHRQQPLGRRSGGRAANFAWQRLIVRTTPQTLMPIVVTRSDKVPPRAPAIVHLSGYSISKEYRTTR